MDGVNRNARDELARQSLQRMVLETWQTASDFTLTSDISCLSLLGLCCVFQSATLMVNMQDFHIPLHDLGRLLEVLGRFSSRWAVGSEARRPRSHWNKTMLTSVAFYIKSIKQSQQLSSKQ